tara:strand:- start:1993 stop:2337 length:345 start_codon:yes stop_codon:yes gene_type:complete
MAKLDILSEDKVFIISMMEKDDTGGIYKAFTDAYWLEASDGFSKRHYFANNDIDAFTLFHSYYSIADPSNDVKAMLNNHHSSNIRFMSEHQNIVVFSKQVTRARFDRLINQKQR